MAEKASAITKKAALLDTNVCVEWPLTTNKFGYGVAWYEGRPQLAHRVVCALVHGDPVKAELEAAHSCGNRRCVNWRHLRWATHAENSRDKIAHGRSRTTRGQRHGMAKLSESSVTVILSRLADGESMSAVARDYEVTVQTIASIKSGKTWAWIPRPGASA